MLPRLARVGLAGKAPLNDRGQRLDPELHVLLDLMERSNRPPLEAQGPEEARQTYRFGVELLGPRCERPVEIVNAHGQHLRVHRPGRGRRPAMVFFHGGGFVIGDAPMYDGVVHQLARHTGCTFISVPYRQAPEHPFPAGVDDAVAGFRWVVDNAHRLGIDPDRIGVMGDSAGGTMAVNVTQAQIEAGRAAPSMQCLVYPAIDRRGAYPSRRNLSQGYILTEEVLDYFTDHYLPDAVDERDPRLAPLRFAHTERIPPTLLVTAGFDPLRDEGEAYARHLRGAGVSVTHLEWPELVHGSFTMGGVLSAPRRRFMQLTRELDLSMRPGRRAVA